MYPAHIKKNRFKWDFLKIFMTSLVLALPLLGCETIKQATSKPTTKKEPLVDKVKPQSSKVAMLLPLSGPSSNFGKSLQQAAELSLFDHGDASLELSFYDTHGTPQGANAAALKAIQAGAGLLVGPVFSNSVEAASGPARAAHVPLISFSTNQDIAGNGVFAFGFSPREQVREVLTYAVSHGYKVIAVIIPRSPYGNMVEEALKQVRVTAGDSIIFEVVYYSGDTVALNKELNPVRTLNPDAIFIPEGGIMLSRIISSLLYQEIPLEKVQFFGTGQWDEESTLTNRTLEGAIIAAPDPRKSIAFDAKYEATYKEKPIRIASLGYDIVAMLSVLRKHYKEAPFTMQHLLQNRGFDGIDGVFRLTAQGIVERHLALLKITPQGPRVLKAPEAHF